MAGSSKRKQQRYSYADYLTWDDDKRYEIIDGEVFDMITPPLSHQLILGTILVQMANYFHDKPCELLMGPLDIALPDGSKCDDKIFTVVQPDIMVICDPKKIEERGIVGAPDLAVEIISPETVRKDSIIKRELYERHGVKEFWLVHPVDRLIRVYKLGKNGLFGREEVYDDQAQIEIAQFAGLSVDCRRLFPPLPKVKRAKSPPPPKYG